MDDTTKKPPLTVDKVRDALWMASMSWNYFGQSENLRPLVIFHPNDLEAGLRVLFELDVPPCRCEAHAGPHVHPSKRFLPPGAEEMRGLYSADAKDCAMCAAGKQDWAGHQHPDPSMRRPGAWPDWAPRPAP